MCDNKYTHTFVVYLFVCLICKQTLVPVYTRVGHNCYNTQDTKLYMHIDNYE